MIKNQIRQLIIYFTQSYRSFHLLRRSTQVEHHRLKRMRWYRKRHILVTTSTETWHWIKSTTDYLKVSSRTLWITFDSVSRRNIAHDLFCSQTVSHFNSIMTRWSNVFQKSNDVKLMKMTFMIIHHERRIWQHSIDQFDNTSDDLDTTAFATWHDLKQRD